MEESGHSGVNADKVESYIDDIVSAVAMEPQSDSSDDEDATSSPATQN